MKLFTANPYKFNMLKTNPASSGVTALVYVNKSNQFHVFTGGNRLPMNEAMFGGYHTFYEVDMSQHVYEYSKLVPSSNPIQQFQVKIRMYFSVQDPLKVIQSNISDAAVFLNNHIDSFVKRITVKYEVSMPACIQIAENIADLLDDGKFTAPIEGAGLRINQLAPDVELSRKVMEHLEGLGAIVDNEAIRKAQVAADANVTKTESGLLQDLLLEHGPVGALLYYAADKSDKKKIIEDVFKERKEKNRKIEDIVLNSLPKQVQNPDELRKMIGIIKETLQSGPTDAQSANEADYNEKKESNESFLDNLEAKLEELAGQGSK